MDQIFSSSPSSPHFQNLYVNSTPPITIECKLPKPQLPATPNTIKQISNLSQSPGVEKRRPITPLIERFEKSHAHLPSTHTSLDKRHINQIIYPFEGAAKGCDDELIFALDT